MLMPIMHRKQLMMGLKMQCLRKLEFFAIAGRPGLPSLQRGTLRFPDGDHLFRVRTGELTSAGDTAAPSNLRKIRVNALFSFSHTMFKDTS